MRQERLPRGFKRTATGKIIKVGATRLDRGFCSKCGLVMDDSEPMGRYPEWRHKVTGRCPNDGESFCPGDARMHGVGSFRPKRDR